MAPFISVVDMISSPSGKGLSVLVMGKFFFMFRDSAITQNISKLYAMHDLQCMRVILSDDKKHLLSFLRWASLEVTSNIAHYKVLSDEKILLISTLPIQNRYFLS
ncbi:hypothetical protein MPL1_11098 [Methylophaga lonarensis MPL]|uniref:Uncharacterized protein n=1 Tax=Methylophaga lonarensis MPL TaxID=1286106 RepID=M7NYJ9_9GAMM|nr:hypothetical protein MPL1_11098 [Methylophaga lonarensis MPL]